MKNDFRQYNLRSDKMYNNAVARMIHYNNVNHPHTMTVNNIMVRVSFCEN